MEMEIWTGLGVEKKLFNMVNRKLRIETRNNYNLTLEKELGKRFVDI